MKKGKFTLADRIKSFSHAIAGLKEWIKTEQNFKIHLIAALLVVISGWLVSLNAQEWLFIAIAIGLVFIAEIINSALETLCDLYSTEFNPKIKRIKDLGAAATLLAAILALTIGIVVFYHKFNL